MEWAGLQGFKWEKKGRGSSGACREVVFGSAIALTPFYLHPFKGAGLKNYPPCLPIFSKRPS